MLSFEDVRTQYGDRLVKFSSYYKYSFCFGDGSLSVYVGGIAEDIYRFTVEADRLYTIAELMEGGISSIYEDGTLMFESGY